VVLVLRIFVEKNIFPKVDLMVAMEEEEDMLL
jgi:hypothetical protein